MKNANTKTAQELALEMGMPISKFRSLCKEKKIPQNGPFTPEQEAILKGQPSPAPEPQPAPEPPQPETPDGGEDEEPPSALDILRGQQAQAQGDMVKAKQRAIAATIAINQQEGAEDGALGASTYISSALTTQANALNHYAIGMVQSRHKNGVIRDLTLRQNPYEILAEVENLKLPIAADTSFSLDFDIQDLEAELERKRQQEKKAQIALPAPAEATPLALSEQVEPITEGEEVAGDSDPLEQPELPEQPPQSPQPEQPLSLVS